MNRHEWRTLLLAVGAMLLGGAFADGNRVMGLVGWLLLVAWAVSGDVYDRRRDRERRR